MKYSDTEILAAEARAYRLLRKAEDGDLDGEVKWKRAEWAAARMLTDESGALGRAQCIDLSAHIARLPKDEQP